jgi:hypothetical protein
MPHCSVEGRLTSIRSNVVRFLSKPHTDSLSSLAAPMSHVGSGLPAPGTTDGERRSRVRHAHRPAHGDSRFVVPRRARRSVSRAAQARPPSRACRGSGGPATAAVRTKQPIFDEWFDLVFGDVPTAARGAVEAPPPRGRVRTRPKGGTRGAHDRNVAGRPGGAPGGAPRASGRKQRGPLREERAACGLPGDPRGT